MIASYAEWVRELLREHRRGRRFGVRCSGCWACDVLPEPIVTDADRQRCKDLSRHAPATIGGFDGHHVLPQQLLKRELEPEEFAAVRYDLRIGVPLRRYHHDCWEHPGVRRLSVPRWILPVGVIEIAEELGLGWYIGRQFGEAVAR